MMMDKKIPRTEKQNGDRNELQRLLLEKCINEGLLTKQDIDPMMEIFRLVSDIIDNPQEEHEEIRSAFEARDFQKAAEMLLLIVKEKIFSGK